MTTRITKHTFQLREVVLVELTVKRLSDVTKQSPPSVSIGMENWGQVVSPQMGNAFVKLTVNFKEAEEAPFAIMAVFRGTIVCEGDAPEEQTFQGFLKDEGLYLLWPYIRQTVSQMTMAMGFPALTLPTLAHSKAIVDRSEDTADAATDDVLPN